MKLRTFFLKNSNSIFSALAAVIAIGVYAEFNMWPFVCLYWSLLSLKWLWTE